jgi:hypothetical protein
VKVKTSELTGAALDWAVAKCEGLEKRECSGVPSWRWGFTSCGRNWWLHEWHPSTDWAQGGPIIGRERICLDQRKGEPCRAFIMSEHWQHEHAQFAPEDEPPVAAMRCFVASKFGDEVDVPEELLS